MNKGKETCEYLKGIRRKIAADNDITLDQAPCSFQGECSGTCPRCDAEISYLQKELSRRGKLSTVASIIGMTMVTTLPVTSCTKGDIPAPGTGAIHFPDSLIYPDSTGQDLPEDTIPLEEIDQ